MGDAAGEDAAETAQGVVLAGPELAGVTLGRGGGDRPAGADDGAAGGGRGGHLSGRSGRRRRPLLLGFDAMEKTLERIAKGSDGYPPYNIERIAAAENRAEALRITLAVAGFAQSDLEVTVQENQLTIRGKQVETEDRDYLHRGIAARQFQRTFMLADGMRVLNADLKNGLLCIDLVKPERVREAKRIDISAAE